MAAHQPRMAPHFCPNLDLFNWPEQSSRGFVSWDDWQTVYGRSLWQAWRHYWHSGSGLPREDALAVAHWARLGRYACHVYQGQTYCFCGSKPNRWGVRWPRPMPRERQI